MSSKKCPDCGIEKDYSEFYPIREKYLTTYCKPCVGVRSAEYRRQHPGLTTASARKNKAKNRGTAWGRAGAIREGMVQRSKGKFDPPEFSRAEIFDIINGGRCERTGMRFEFSTGDSKSRNPWTPVPDRIDSTLGYTKANVQWVCNMYNAAKQSWTNEEVDKMLNSIYNFRPGDF